MVSSIGSYSASAAMAMSRPDPAQMASKLFSKLDTKGQGFIEQSDLQSAFSQVFSGASSSSSGSDSSALFTALDGNSDGKVTESEFSSGIQKLADALDSQAFASRMGGAQGAGGMPPPPPPQGDGDGDGDDAGFTKDQLQSQLDQIGTTDSKRSALISSVVSNFDKADTDGDGKVSRTEAMAYQQSTQSASSSAGTDAAGSTTTSAAQSDAALMHRVMELMRAYGSGDSTASSASQVLSVSA